MSTHFFVLILFWSGAFAVEEPPWRIAVDQLVQSAVQGTDPAESFKPKKWSTRPEAELVDLNKVIHTDFHLGIGYGAIVSKIIEKPFSEIRKALFEKGNIFRLVAAVKTQKDFVKLAQTDRELSLKLSIDVPVLSNFRTQDRIRVYEQNGRGVLEWQQIGDEGDLAYNHGVMIINDDRDRTKAFVLGVHIIKPERKIPWFGRGTAAAFAKSHYTNYITALEEVSASK